MFNSMYAAHEVQLPFLHQHGDGRLQFDPETDGLKGLGRQIEGKDTHQLLPGERPLFISHHPLGHLEMSLTHKELSPGPASDDLENFRFLLRANPGEVLALGPVGNNVLLVQDELIHQVLCRPVQVDGTGVTFGKGPETVHRAYGLAGPTVKNGIAVPNGPDIDVQVGIAFRGKPGRHPLCGPGQAPVRFEGVKMPLQVPCPVSGVFQSDGLLGSRTGEMGLCHERVVGIQHRSLIGPVKEFVRVFDEILIQGVRLGNQDQHGFPA